MVSYSQMGEDLVAKSISEMLGMALRGVTSTSGLRSDSVQQHLPPVPSTARGVLVEPNPTFAAKLRSARPGDVVLEAGIGTM